MQDKIAYIGDGVYCEFDGYGMWLRTGHYETDKCENKIYLEPSVLRSLMEFYKGISE